MNPKSLLSTVLYVLYATALPSNHKNTKRIDAATYTTYVAKGTQILNDIQRSPGDTIGLAEKYETLYLKFATTSELARTSTDFQDMTAMVGNVLGFSTLVEITISRPCQDIAYKNYFDVAKGIIVGASNFNYQFFYEADNADLGSNPDNPRKSTDNSLQWNTIVGEQYKSLGGSMEKLQHILRFPIVNPDTADIIDQATETTGLTVLDGWTVLQEDGPGAEMFKALLGTENGRGAGYMLKDYRASMGRKSIQAIRVKEQDREHAMLIDYV